MQTQPRVHGIVNGHWEPTSPEPPKVVQLVRTGVAKLMQKISAHSHAHDSSSPHDESRQPVAAE